MDKQKVWVVCGAGESIGPATVQYLLLRGQKVVAIPSSYTDREEALKMYQAKFPMADIWLTNIFHSPDTEKAVRQIVEQYGRIDRLINIGDGGLLSLYVLSAMQKAGNGHIIQFLHNESDKEVETKQAPVSLSHATAGTGGILYSVIEPGLFFQSMLYHQPNDRT
ncbi:MAG: SDR family NAD(P)-dependent oxidoreductase [Niastella sp.]|nr:SDR family NAD(P)-dependent oxidoreductase [Niastella sp.]